MRKPAAAPPRTTSSPWPRKPKACLVAEPGHEGEGYVTAERFGRSVVTITARGVAGHAGNRPEYTANPFVELSDVVEYLESRCDRERGIWYSPVSLHGGDKGPTAMTPEDAYVIYDIRYVDETLQKEAEETLRSLKPKQANVHFEISGGMEKPPFRQTEAQQLASRAGEGHRGGNGASVPSHSSWRRQ